MKKIIILLILAGFSSNCVAQDSDPVISSNVWLVKTQGTWVNGKEYGYYRIVVSRIVGDHGGDSTTLEILKVVDDSLKVIKQIRIPSPGYKGYVNNISFLQLDDKSQIICLD
ncbi:MAG: hypothetical protein Q9M12_03675, partial [Mariprofundus sp.]|nr:hypothetical protein [Mariprofundus sp.]